MNNFSLVLQATYTSVEYALYNNKEKISQHSLIKTLVCTELMYQLCSLLKEHHLTWQMINHIIINQGPAPFTTLRGLIATVNGISFAQKIPLIAVDGLAAFTKEIGQVHKDFLILLNAFAGDFYYSLHSKEYEQKGCGNYNVIREIVHHYKNSNNVHLFIVGNGISLIKDQLEKDYKDSIILDTNHDFVRLETIAQEGFILITTKLDPVFHVSPLYLKNLSYQPSCLV